MSDEQRKDEQTEVEAHVHKGLHVEPSDEGDSEVEAHVLKARPAKSVHKA